MSRLLVKSVGGVIVATHDDRLMEMLGEPKRLDLYRASHIECKNCKFYVAWSERLLPYVGEEVSEEFDTYADAVAYEMDMLSEHYFPCLNSDNLP